MSFSLPSERRSRRPSLTPMIDVVFLLLVFFMLASRFGMDMQVPLTLAGQGTGYSGPPRLVDIGPQSVSLNGTAMDEASLADALRSLMEGPEDTVILRAQDDATLQRVVAIMELLGAADFTTVVLVE